MAQKITNEPHYDLVREIKTGRVFLAEYSREAAEWYEKGTGNAYPLYRIEMLPTIKGWAARDEDGRIWLHGEKPVRYNLYGGRNEWTTPLDLWALPKEMLPEITWESEPVEVELIIRKI